MCTVCNGWMMLLVCMGKTRFGGIIWGEVVMMHKSFPFQCIFSASLPTFRKGVHCTKALHSLTHAVRTLQCAVRISTLQAVRRCNVHFCNSDYRMCSTQNGQTVGTRLQS